MCLAACTEWSPTLSRCPPTRSHLRLLLHRGSYTPVWGQRPLRPQISRSKEPFSLQIRLKSEPNLAALKPINIYSSGGLWLPVSPLLRTAKISFMDLILMTLVKAIRQQQTPGLEFGPLQSLQCGSQARGRLPSTVPAQARAEVPLTSLCAGSVKAQHQAVSFRLLSPGAVQPPEIQSVCQCRRSQT